MDERNNLNEQQCENTHQFYLLECEIVGIEHQSNIKKLIVSPVHVYPKSSWTGVSDDFVILLLQSSGRNLIVKTLNLNDSENKTLSLTVGDDFDIQQLLHFEYLKTVLILDEENKVVGFKALRK